MRILHISKYYFPYIGGIESICQYLAEGMPSHQMAVLCFNDKCKDEIVIVNGITVYRVATWINLAKQALSLSYFYMMHRAIKEFKPDIIHFHWANPFPAAILLIMIPCGIRLVVHWHMDIINQTKIYKFIKPMETALLKRADLVIVTSPQYRDGSEPLQAFKNKVKIVPNAINEKKMQLVCDDEEQIRAVQEKYKGKKIVFFVGRHIQYKGLSYLIDAEKYIKSDCVIIVAGKGPLTEKLKKQCHSNRVYFVGKLSEDELRWHYHASSVFAFPSITKNEAFGVALAEAMYCNVPAVTFFIPGSGVNWVNLNGVTGIEVPNRDTKAFARAIDKLLLNDTLAQKYGKAAHKRIGELFLIQNMLDEMEKCYKAL